MTIVEDRVAYRIAVVEMEMSGAGDRPCRFGVSYLTVIFRNGPRDYFMSIITQILMELANRLLLDRVRCRNEIDSVHILYLVFITFVSTRRRYNRQFRSIPREKEVWLLVGHLLKTVDRIRRVLRIFSHVCIH